VYESILPVYRDKEIVLVEIGIFQGGSLFMWREYFGPKARIIGIDANPGATELREHGFEIHIGNQAEPAFWKRFFDEVGSIDILIDDGGHWNEQQIKTVAYCADHIRDGGVLIVEDTQTSYYDWMGNPSRYSFIEYTKFLADVINARNTQITTPAAAPLRRQALGGLIYSIRIFNSVVCFEIDRTKSYMSKPISNASQVVGHTAVGMETSDYGSVVAALKSNPVVGFLQRHCSGLLKPGTKMLNKALFALNNRKLRAFFR
jgi:hypothetical protein